MSTNVSVIEGFFRNSTISKKNASSIFLFPQKNKDLSLSLDLCFLIEMKLGDDGEDAPNDFVPFHPFNKLAKHSTPHDRESNGKEGILINLGYSF